MMNAAPPAFEVLRDQLAALEVPAGNARTLAWIVPGRLGTALTATGAYEIFLCGPELSATVPLVARHLQHPTMAHPPSPPPVSYSDRHHTLQQWRL